MGKTIIPLAIKASFSGSTSTTHTVTDVCEALSVVNRGATDVTVTVEDISVTVAADETFSGAFRDFTAVIVTASDAYALVVMGR